MRNVFIITYKNDPELVALYYELGAKLFSNFIKDALRHVVRINYVGTTDVPNVLLLDSSKEGAKIKINLSLTAAKDADVVSLLQSLKPKMVSRFIKQCTKLYLGTKGLEAFFNKSMNEKLSPSVNPRIAPVVFQFGESATIPKTKMKKNCTSSYCKQVKSKIANPVASLTPNLPQTQNQQSTTTQSPISVSAPEQKQENTVENATSNLNIHDIDIVSDTNTDEDDVLAMLESLLS